MTIEEAINLALGTERILSLILLWLVIWFTRNAWPDLMALRKDAQAIKRLEAEAEADRELERIKAEIEVQRQTVLELTALNQNLTDWFAEIRAVSATQTIQHNILLHILEKGNPDVPKAAPPPDIVGRG